MQTCPPGIQGGFHSLKLTIHARPNLLSPTLSFCLRPYSPSKAIHSYLISLSTIYSNKSSLRFLAHNDKWKYYIHVLTRETMLQRSQKQAYLSCSLKLQRLSLSTCKGTENHQRQDKKRTLLIFGLGSRSEGEVLS